MFINNDIRQMKASRLIRFDWAIKTILRITVNFPILEGFLSELIRSQVTIKTLNRCWVLFNWG
ncbi:MAG: hypothetical protein ACH346_05775, partial [Chthoniobacterales bacterium]